MKPVLIEEICVKPSTKVRTLEVFQELVDQVEKRSLEQVNVYNLVIIKEVLDNGE